MPAKGGAVTGCALFLPASHGRAVRAAARPPLRLLVEAFQPVLQGAGAGAAVVVQDQQIHVVAVAEQIFLQARDLLRAQLRDIVGGHLLDIGVIARVPAGELGACLLYTSPSPRDS